MGWRGLIAWLRGKAVSSMVMRPGGAKGTPRSGLSEVLTLQLVFCILVPAPVRQENQRRALEQGSR